MNKRTVIIGGVALFLLLSGVALVHFMGPTPAQRASPAPSLPQFHFPAGHTWSYRLDYQGQSAVSLAGSGVDSGGLSGQVHLAGELVLRGHGAHGQLQRVGLRLETLHTHEMKLFGHELLPDEAAVAATFGDREALLDFLPDGTLQAVSFPEDAPSLFKNTLQTLVGELQVVLRPGAQWRAEETTTRGRAFVDYQRLSAESDAHVRLLKQRARYPEPRGLGQGGTFQLTSRFEAEVAAEGVLENLQGEERLVRIGADGKPAATTYVRVHLVRGASGRFQPKSTEAQSVALQQLAPGELVMDPRVARSMLAQQVDGLTEARFFELLGLHANGGVFPNHNHFLLQATGLLEQQPELCARLVEFFQQESLKPVGRAFVLDLLANTGTPEAQAALVQALSSPAARQDRGYAMYLSRLSLVAQPTLDTVRFAERMQTETQGHARIASTYALGATAGALYRNEQSPEAQAAVQRLASTLSTTTEPQEQAHLLLALGNAGLEEHTSLISRYAESEDPAVRRASAKALRKVSSPEALHTLLTLAADTHAPVQAAAIESLGRRPLDEVSLGDLENMVLSGAVKVDNFHTMLNLLEPYVSTDPAVRRMLEYMLKQDVPDRQVLTRIRGILNRP